MAAGAGFDAAGAGGLSALRADSFWHAINEAVRAAATRIRVKRDTAASHHSYSRRVKRGRRWIDLESDLFGAFSSSVGAVRRGELGLGSYLMSLLRANVYARLDLRDPAPAFRRTES